MLTTFLCRDIAEKTGSTQPWNGRKWPRAPAGGLSPWRQYEAEISSGARFISGYCPPIHSSSQTAWGMGGHMWRYALHKTLSRNNTFQLLKCELASNPVRRASVMNWPPRVPLSIYSPRCALTMTDALTPQLTRAGLVHTHGKLNSPHDEMHILKCKYHQNTKHLVSGGCFLYHSLSGTHDSIATVLETLAIKYDS